MTSDRYDPPGGPAPWEVLADVLLQREAALCRIVAGVPPRDFAGMYVEDADVERALRSLPGIQSPPAEDASALRKTFAPALADARHAFLTWLGADDDGSDRWADRFRTVVRRCALDATAAEVLALLVAVELDPQRQRLVSYLQDSVHLPRLTLAVLPRLLADTALLAVSPAGPLCRAALVDVEPTGPWARRMCSVATRVVWALVGDDSPDPALPVGTWWRPGLAADRPPGPLLLVNGADRESRLRVVSGALGDRHLLVASPPFDAAGWDALVREAGVTGAGVVLELTGSPDDVLRDRVRRAGHLCWALSSPRELPLESLPRVPHRELQVTDGIATDADWSSAFGAEPPQGIRMTREQLRLVTAASDGDGARVAEGIRRLAGGLLEGVALRVRPRRDWADLVLPEDQKRQLHELADRHRLRGRVYGEWGYPTVPSTGVVALFAGPSGTGKTLAAEVVANALGLDLYKVDLSAVVSKYIGETEKNLERIFSAAATGDMVLFFDEADAIFGKRSEVSDAHDRYANIEVAYLLQRLESYDGLVVMATNLQRNIDQAFLRRISVALDFVSPDEQQRRAIWERSFPPAAPRDGIDLDFLARQFKVTGGVIRNVALTAAFLAAGAGRAADGRAGEQRTGDRGAEDRERTCGTGEVTGAISMEHVVLAMDREFGKLGRLRTEAEFDRYFDLVQGSASPPDPAEPSDGTDPGAG